MKRSKTLQIGWPGMAAAVLLAAALSPNAPAQSGRVIPTPTPTPTPEAVRTPKVEEPKFVPDPNAEKYRLVFATRYRGNSFSTRTYDEMVPVLRAAFDDFIEGLNRAGAQGYRVVTSLKGDPAVVALDEAQYEYAWTHTRSPDATHKPGFAGAYGRLAKKGFRLAAHSMLYASCNYYGGAVPGEPYMQDCEYGDFFLFERRKGSESPREYALADTKRGGRGKNQTDEDVLTAAVRTKLAAGFSPAHLLSKSEILLEREPPDPALAEAGAEVRVVRSANLWDSDELPKRVNALARQGFRLALAGHKIALMYRRPGTPPPLTYVWLKSSKKDFEKELARLQEAGAVFRSTYPDETGARRALIFEQGQPARREYRLLRFELQTRHNAAEQVMETTLAPASAGAQKELNRLAAEGFVVLALFDADNYKITWPGKGREGLVAEEFGVLLERQR